MQHPVKSAPTIDYDQLALLLDQTSRTELYAAIADAPFANKVDMVTLFMGFICVYIVDPKTNLIHLEANSATKQYDLAVEKFKFKADEYYLDFTANKDNSIVQAISTNKPVFTSDWATLNRGQTPVEVVRLNQANSGIACTFVYMLTHGVKGALMYNYYQYRDEINDEQRDFMERYTDLVSMRLANEFPKAGGKS